METTKESVIAQEAQWINYIDSCADRGCLGINDCDSCQKFMYASRTKYLACWLNVYVCNERELKEGTVTMKPLLWKHANSAKYGVLRDFHRKKCSTLQRIADCDCETASLFKKTFYGPVNDEDKQASLDIIYDAYIKTKKSLK